MFNLQRRSLRRVVQLRCCLLFFYSQVCSFRPVARPGTLVETIVDTTVEAMLETIRSVTGQEHPTSTIQGTGPAWRSRQSVRHNPVEHSTGPAWEAISRHCPGISVHFRALSATALVHYPQPRLAIAGGAASGVLNRSRRESSI